MALRKDPLQEFPRVGLSLLPTPLVKLENISKTVPASVYCKRDDLTGFALGGNKTRKLEYLVAEALRKGADTLVTAGALQSNFCRIAAAAGRSQGLEVHLVLGGSRPEKLTGNVLLDHLFAAQVHYVDSSEWGVWEEKAMELARVLASRGKKVCRLPIGGSTPTGALGYVQAFYEIMADCARLGISPGTIIHASSSGGTQAGLLVGKTLTGWPGKILGMAVAKTGTSLAEEVYQLAGATGKLLGCTVRREYVVVDGAFMGAGYGARTPEAEAAVHLFAEREGILLDNVYTGKAAAGLLDYARRGFFRGSESVLFIHTGGSVELFE
jgi:L-cysteate sulfo-lyase